MAKDDRKKIAERLLRERLGLDEDWLNRDEDGTAHLPSALPRFLTQSLSRPALKALEQDLDRLVGAGCRRQALYFCLAQLNPEADWSRTQLVATKQDMEAIANKAKAARKLIQRYRAELLLAATVNPQGLPGGMFTTLRDPDEVISVLMNSLTWVSSLADSYTAPFERTLLKSKGLLYLTLYVSKHADEQHRRALHSQSKIGAAPRDTRRSKPATPPPEHTLASVARLCTAKRWSPSDLRGKLKRFQGQHPTLYTRMKSKMAELWRWACRDIDEMKAQTARPAILSLTSF
jgi:hypothetical protein